MNSSQITHKTPYGPGLPRRRKQQRRRCIAQCRHQRVQLVVDGVRLQCPLLGLPPHLARTAGWQQPWVRFSVALPPGIGRGRPGPGLPRRRKQQKRQCIAQCRHQRVQLVVDIYGLQRPLLGLQLRLSRPNGQQNARWARFSVAVPPGRGYPLGGLLGLSLPNLQPGLSGEKV